MAKPVSIDVRNPNGKYRIVSTKPMPGTRWINLLIEQDCRVKICTKKKKKTILSVEDIIALIGDNCDGVIGQLTEDWGEALVSALREEGPLSVTWLLVITTLMSMRLTSMVFLLETLLDYLQRVRQSWQLHFL
ncbi:glycerate dehydrogenase-like [Carya illinoinensis]|uniref:glycerate dehydrogenase-like n=1 Tax=Carya illinoinensis TaxID=32201 RepID=UPI001C71AAE6|nr:glycerate dehydrogenase-like [Carya illinoinensis]